MRQAIRSDEKRRSFTGALPKERLPVPVLADHPRWVRLYWQTLKIGWQNIRRDAGAHIPPHMACMPDVPIIWQWDSCFMAMFCRFLNGAFPGLNNLDILYRFQRKDGFIAMAYNVIKSRPAFGELINPPLYAWAEWAHYLAAGDRDRIGRVYPGLARYFDWVKRNRRRDNGLYWFELPGASGMDNSPRGGSFDRRGSDLCHVDLICRSRAKAGDQVRVEVRSQKAFRLVLEWKKTRADTLAVKPGRNRFEVQARV